MEPQKLIKKIDDRDAVSILIGRYGKKIYARLYNSLQDKQLADEAFRKTVFSFLETVKRLENDDLTEALFSCVADGVCRDMLDCGESEHENADIAHEDTDIVQESADIVQESANIVSEDTGIVQENADAEPEPEDNTPAPAEDIIEFEEYEEEDEYPTERGCGLEIAVMLILIALVVILLWTVAGLGMQCGLIPSCDLGYTWFDMNVFPLFCEYGV